MEIYNHLFSKCFKSVVVGYQKMVQYKYFFWHEAETSLLKICKVRNFLREDIIFHVKWVELRKWVRFFEQNCMVKSVIFFASFCWLWNFPLENLKLKKKIGWNLVEGLDKYKNFVCQKQYFQKMNSKYEIF